MSAYFKSIGLIGFGKFGQLLNELLQKAAPEASVAIYDTHHESYSSVDSLKAVSESQLVILSCPISAVEQLLEELSTRVLANTVIMDVCSIKLHVRNCMERILPAGNEIICTHPMFGPATYMKSGGDLKNFKVVVDNVRSSHETFEAVKSLLQAMGPEVIQMSSDEHDRLAARFQFTTLSTALILKEMDLNRSQIDTGSASAMMDFVEMVSVDKQLLRDMYTYNPYCKQKWNEFEKAFHTLEDLFLQAQR